MTPTTPYHPWRDATSLIATAAYTRGLWSVLFLWRALTPRAFKSRPAEWGVDEEMLRAEMKRALLLFIPITAVQVLLYAAFIRWGSLIAAFVFVLSLLLEWTVIPWFAARRLLAQRRSTPAAGAVRTVVAASVESPLGDLGFLLREATFAVDTSKAESETPREVAAALVDRVESRFGQAADQGLTVQRVRVVPVDHAQPTHWSLADSRSHLDVAAGEGTDRVVVFGQRPGEDGLAAVEFSVNAIKEHVSITIRARWLPPLRKRFGRLACLPLQKAWWRAFAVPVILTVTLLGIWSLPYIPGWIADGTMARAGKTLMQGLVAPATLVQEPPPATETTATATEEFWLEEAQTDTAATDTTATDVNPYAAVPAEEPAVGDASAEAQATYEQILAEQQPEQQPEPEPAPSWLQNAADLMPPSLFSIAFLVQIAAYIAFLPVVGFAVLLLTRAGRYIRGFLYAVTGTVMNVATPNCYRFRASQLALGDDGAVRSGLKYLQIIEECVLETTIAALQERNIDTKSIRDEAQVLINEGIYMTGGSLQASNVVVGAFAKLGARRRQKLARAGRVAYSSMPQRKAG